MVTERGEVELGSLQMSFSEHSRELLKKTFLKEHCLFFILFGVLSVFDVTWKERKMKACVNKEVVRSSCPHCPHKLIHYAIN